MYYLTSGNSDIGSLGPFVAYHFGGRAARTRPFVQAGLGIGLTGDSDVSFNGAAGLKHFFLPGGALRGQAFVNAGGDTIFGVLGGVSIFL